MSPSIRRRLGAVASLLLTAAITSSPAAAATPRDGSTVRIPGHVLPALAGATRVERGAPADGTEPLALTVVLRRNDEAAFARYLRDVYDPASADFRRFLSPEAQADRFGPTRAQYRDVARYLAQRGFTIVARSASRLTLAVRGTRAAAARALALHVGDYRLGDTTFFANDDDPALPPDLASTVAAVAGLANLARPRPQKQLIKEIKKATYVPLICWVNANLIQDPNPAVQAEKYNTCVTNEKAKIDAETLTTFPLGGGPLALTLDGTGQTIGVLAFDRFDSADVADYLAFIGAPAATITHLSRVAVGGGATAGADQAEVLLDVDAILTVAPGANVVVYDGPFTGLGSFQSLFSAMIDDGIDVITNSWAYCEDQTTLADVQSIDAILQSAAAAGISVFSASGDTGSTCLDGSPNTLAVPASSPSLTAVGGTSRTWGPGYIWESERWWNGSADPIPTGQGGFGTSRFFARPAFQNGFTASPMRSVPDVVFNADPAIGVPICQAAEGGCPSGALFGGTSVAAPIWAALAALLNQANGANLGSFNAVAYPFAGTDAFHGPAELGSDFAHVGLGSPNLNALRRRVMGDTAGAPNTAQSSVITYVDYQPFGPVPAPQVAADGVDALSVVVRLRDIDGHYVTNKTISLVADSPEVTIVPATAVTDVANGAAVFTVTSLTAESVTFTATDTTDGFPLPNEPTIVFAVPPAASGGIQAFPNTVPANGTSTTTISITLQDVLGRPTPGKLIRLNQGGGHSVITGPNPAVTNASGQIQFTATNRVNEVVTYTAVVETDGDVPVPGSAQVTYDGASTSCVGPPPVGVNGYAVTPFATGFAAEPFFYGNVNWGGCPGASAPAFRGSDAFVASFRTGGLYRFGVEGGAVSSANVVGTVGLTLGWPAVGKDGKLYAALGSSGVGGATGSVVELNPDTGAIVRTLASGQKCTSGLVVDPLSGDLFFTGQCFGAGLDEPIIRRIRNPGSMSPTVETYTTLAQTPNGNLAFAPNGTLYAATAYTSQNPSVIRITGTDQPSPPVQTTVNGVTSIFFIGVGAAGANGEATSLLGFTSDGLVLYDITTSPATPTLIVEDMVPGVIGPDGCMYGGLSDIVYKVTRADGSCDFAPSSAVPSLTLAPATASPDPAQGTEQELTATFRNVAVPEGTAVFFQIAGANPDLRMERTNVAGEATLRYVGLATGADVVTASARVVDGLDEESFVSNKARITWTPGAHTTSLSLNLSPNGAVPGLPSVLTAVLVDGSGDLPVPVAGQTITFTRGAATCSAVTDAAGVATCVLLADETGQAPLVATFAGAPGLLPATDTLGFSVVGNAALSPFSVYQSKQSKGTKFVKFGPVVLDDDLATGVGYDVQKLERLAAPAGTNGGMSPDPDTHLTSYAVKRAKNAPKFVKATDVRLLNQCSDSVLTLGKPASLLLPTAKSLVAAPPVPTDADHNVDHFLCYKAKQQKKYGDGTPAPALRKGIQVDVEDQFQTTRYDLGKVVLACNPVAKSGSPILQGGPAKGSSFPITPATVRNPAAHLLCYSAKIATKRIEQNGCGPAVAGDKGTKIVPKQAKHVPQLGLHLANQFGTTNVDTKKVTFVCIPSVLGP